MTDMFFLHFNNRYLNIKFTWIFGCEKSHYVPSEVDIDIYGWIFRSHW